VAAMHYGPDPDNYIRNVIDAETWGRAHLPALRLIYGEFDRSGHWPQVETLQRALLRRHSTVDLVGELAQMPPAIGVVQHDGEISLSIRALSLLPETSDMLGRFIAVIELAVDRFRGEEESPKITDEDLTAMGMDSTTAARVSALIVRESWPFGGGSGFADGSWERSISLEIRHLVAVRRVEDYLRVQAELRYGPPPSASKHPQGQPVPPGPAAGPAPRPVAPIHRASESPSQPSPVRVPGRGVRRMSAGALLRLVFKVLTKLKEDGYFIEAFEGGEWLELTSTGDAVLAPARVEDPEAWLMLSIGIEGLWADIDDPRRLADSTDPSSPLLERQLLFETLELLHRDAISSPVFDVEGAFEGFYDRAAGQLRLREVLGPILAALDPAMEMLGDGAIVPRAAQGLEQLADQPLPPSAAADDVREKVQDAVRLFRDRGASLEDRRAALSQLAGVLERLRADGRLERAVVGKDQAALFEIANKYAIRHDNPTQRREYGPAFLEWIFHAYLAAIRLATLLCEEGEADGG
jgi:hypothetical protein